MEAETGMYVKSLDQENRHDKTQDGGHSPLQAFVGKSLVPNVQVISAQGLVDVA